MILPLVALLSMHRPIPAPDPSTALPSLAPKPPHLDSGRTYENPRFIVPTRAGHLLPDEARNFSLDVVAARTVIVTIRSVPLSDILPSSWMDILENDQSASTAPASKCRKSCFSIPSRVWRKSFHQERSDKASHWTISLDLDSFSRAWGGTFLEVSYKAPPRDFTPRVDTSWCDSLRHIEHLLVGNLGVLLENHDEDSALVATFDLTSAKPRGGVDIFALAENGSIVGRAKTDSSGVVRLRLAKATRVVARTKSEQAWMATPAAKIQWGGLSVNGVEHVNKHTAPPSPRLFPFLAHQVHRPGEQVVASCLVRVPGKGRAPDRVSVEAITCHRRKAVWLDIPADGIVQWRFYPPLGYRPDGGSWDKPVNSTCYNRLVWSYQGVKSISPFSVEEPWRERNDMANPPRPKFDKEAKTKDWHPDSIASLAVLREGDTLSWDESSPSAGISLVQVLQGNRVLRQFWQPLQAGSNKLRIAVDSSWDPHVVVTWTMIGKRTAHDTTWRPSRRTGEFRVERTLRDLSFSLETSMLPDGKALRIRVKNPSSRTGTLALWVLDTGTLGLDHPWPDRFSAFQHMPETVTQSWWDGLGEAREPYRRWTGRDCDLHTTTTHENRCSCPFGYAGGLEPRSFPSYVMYAGAIVLSERPVPSPFAWTPPMMPFGPGDLDVVVPLNGHRGPWVAGVVGASGDIFGRARIVVPAIRDTIPNPSGR